MIKELTALECCDNQNGNSKSYNLQVKNLVHKGVDFYVENALKLTYEYN